MATSFIKLNMPYRLLDHTSDAYVLVDRATSDTINVNTFVPKLSEIFFFPEENGYRTIKVGDGEKTLAELPFAGTISSGSGTTYTINNTNGKTVLINDADGTEQEILPFYVNDQNELCLQDKQFKYNINRGSNYHGMSDNITDFSAYPVLYYRDFEIGKTYYYAFDSACVAGTISYNGNKFIVSGPLVLNKGDGATYEYLPNHDGVTIYEDASDLTILGVCSTDGRPRIGAITYDETFGIPSISPIVTQAELNTRLNGTPTQGEAENTLIMGDSAKAVSKGSTAIGANVSAGTKAFYIEAIDKENKKIYLRTESVDGVATIPAEAARQGVGTTTSYDTGYTENDEFSVINGTHYAFCGTITAISGNVITYEPKVRFTSNIEATGVTSDYISRSVEISEAFSTIATVDSTEYWKEYIFWVPAKPECGFIIQNTDGEQYFQGAQTLGDNNKASANAAFVTGTDNIAGGKGATILGTRNRGGYSALTSGGDNVCIGQHSATLGRNLFNITDYSVLTGRNNMCLSPRGSYGNFIAGLNNVITLGSGISLFGRGHKCGQTNGARFGKYSLDNADIFSVGVGNSTDDRKNAMSILEDGSTFFYGGTTLIGGAYVEPVYDNKLVLNFRNEDEYKLSTSSSNGGGYYVAAGTNGALNWSKATKSAQYTTTANSTNWFQRYNATGFASGLIYPYIKLRYRTTAESQSGGQPRTALLWRTTSKGGDNGAKPVAGDYVDYNNNKDVYLINDGEWHDIIYCLTDSSNWVDISNPTITLLRQAFYNGLTKPVEIAQFGLFKTLKEAQSAATIDEIATKTWVEKNGGGTVNESQVREIVEDMLLNGEW